MSCQPALCSHGAALHPLPAYVLICQIVVCAVSVDALCVTLHLLSIECGGVECSAFLGAEGGGFCARAFPTTPLTLPLAWTAPCLPGLQYPAHAEGAGPDTWRFCRRRP